MWLHRFFGIDQGRVAIYDGIDEPLVAITAVIYYGTSILYQYSSTIKIISLVPLYLASHYIELVKYAQNCHKWRIEHDSVYFSLIPNFAWELHIS